jgi:hypothetical protein
MPCESGLNGDYLPHFTLRLLHVWQLQETQYQYWLCISINIYRTLYFFPVRRPLLNGVISRFRLTNRPCVLNIHIILTHLIDIMALRFNSPDITLRLERRI